MRDESTGKFVWVDGTLDDSTVQAKDGRPYEGSSSASGGEGIPSEPAARPWLIIGLLVAAVAGVATWGVHAYGGHSESISNIRTRPASYDGQTVVLKGRIGDVFQVGGSSAYYLHQGQDTIVVFTRGPRPTPQQNVTVHGSISMGYLDGAARPALFQTQATP